MSAEGEGWGSQQSQSPSQSLSTTQSSPTRPSPPTSPQGVRPGVVLWSHGRSATDSFALSFSSSSGLRYCNGEKEGFKRGWRALDEEALRRCVRAGEMFMHLKPMHLEMEGRPGVEEFFEMAKRAGFGTVVASFRRNVLAREVSSYELNRENGNVNMAFKFGVSMVENNSRSYQEGELKGGGVGGLRGVNIGK